MLINIPRFKCFVEKKYLTDNKESGLLEAYCIAVTLIESRPLLFTVHTIEGALYSRLPVEALFHKKPQSETPVVGNLDIWGAISSNGHAMKYEYLKDYHVRIDSTGETQEGMYAFTIDYFDGGFAEDPEQHKTSNIIFLENGQICAAPNNYCRFLDKHFVKTEIETQYKRNSRYYSLPS